MGTTIRKIICADKGYYAYLSFAVIIGFIFLLFRSRLGVDLTDDAWYTADPYWVAKGSIPYVNNWTQASGFTLPLFVFHYLFLKIVGGNEGIVLFSRILYCAWKTLVVFLSFLFLQRANFRLPVAFATILIVFTPLHLFAINYNTIGITYLFLCFSILALSFDFRGNKSPRSKFLIGMVVGAIMGRCVIGTPVTVLACFAVLLFLLLNKEKSTLKGYVVGGMIAFFSVASFCCVKGGIGNFIVGLQYFFTDVSYYDSIKTLGLSIGSENSFLFKYVLPALATIALGVFLRFFLQNKSRTLNILLICISTVMLVYSFYWYCFFGDVGAASDRDLIRRVSGFTRYGWFVPIVCALGKYDGELNRRLRMIAYYVLILFCVFVFQGYVTIYGMQSRAYWNYSSVLLAIYSVGCCIVASANDKKMDLPPLFNSRTCIALVSCFLCFLALKSAYCYVYRDLPTKNLTTVVESGVWKGCYTTSQRAKTVVALEEWLKARTGETDQVLCWGVWSSFMNLFYNGHLCSASPLGTGAKNGFDFWHMQHVVPNKVFVHIDENDSKKILSDSRPVWIFIVKFYKKTDEIHYVSYDIRGAPVNYKILEYKLDDFDNALKYSDYMATKVIGF